MEVFVYAPEQLEVFGFERCHVFDPHRIVRDRYGKSYAQRLRTVSAGAFSKITWLRIERDPLSFLRDYPGRRVATLPRKDATSLHGFRFRHSDLLVIGSEGRGLDAGVLAECQAQVTIPQAGVTESLNVAVASGIVLFEFKRQESLCLLEAEVSLQGEASES
jgi:tRNA G18 (ribose-2'-O)-methylase SpoU